VCVCVCLCEVGIWVCGLMIVFCGNLVLCVGKTLAFGVPAIMHVLNKRKGKMSKGRWPLCLVLSPTRELAQQVCYD
jgi:hypothetical protein